MSLGVLFEVNWILYVQVTIFITFLKNNRVKIDLLFYINAELWDLDDIYHASLGIQILYTIMSLGFR
jgi:hypothetical protein